MYYCYYICRATSLASSSSSASCSCSSASSLSRFFSELTSRQTRGTSKKNSRVIKMEDLRIAKLKPIVLKHSTRPISVPDKVLFRKWIPDIDTMVPSFLFFPSPFLCMYTYTFLLLLLLFFFSLSSSSSSFKQPVLNPIIIAKSMAIVHSIYLSSLCHNTRTLRPRTRRK